MNGAERGVTHTVRTTEPGLRLDRMLAGALPQFSRSRLKALIEDGRVTSAGATITDASYRVKQGQSFAVFVPEPTPATPVGQAIGLEVIYEDADLIVIDKPAGMVVHPAAGNPDRTLVNALIAHCGDSLSGIGGIRRPGIVHRLDKDTTGLMVAAKTDAAHAALTGQFAARSIERAYIALVWDAPRPSAGTIEGRIGRSPRNRKKMAVLTAGGRPAITTYATQRRFGTVASLLDCRLATGRTHQIRVHLAHRGHPVIGDPAYGGGLTPARERAVGAEAAAAIRRLGRQALHARLLGFRHPSTGQPVRLEQPPPPDMDDLIRCLE